MPVPTHVDQARTRVRAEREAIEAKHAAFETFRDRVRELPTAPAQSAASGMTATASLQPHAETSASDRCRAVRTAFAETIRPHSIGDAEGSEPLLETIRAEFTDAIAVALAPTSETAFSEKLKRLLVSQADARLAETEALCRAFAREETHLENASEVVDVITSWIASADETPLSDLGFEALRERHKALAAHRDRCERLARRRQEFLRKTTNKTAEVGISHCDLPAYLYEDFPVDHPLLVTVARLDTTCTDCQQAVRDHLVRRA